MCTRRPSSSEACASLVLTGTFTLRKPAALGSSKRYPPWPSRLVTVNNLFFQPFADPSPITSFPPALPPPSCRLLAVSVSEMWRERTRTRMRSSWGWTDDEARLKLADACCTRLVFLWTSPVVGPAASILLAVTVTVPTAETHSCSGNRAPLDHVVTLPHRTERRLKACQSLCAKLVSRDNPPLWQLPGSACICTSSSFCVHAPDPCTRARRNIYSLIAGLGTRAYVLALGSSDRMDSRPELRDVDVHGHVAIV